MQSVWRQIGKRLRDGNWAFGSVIAIAGLLFLFAVLADEVMEGSTAGFDRSVVVAFRSLSANSSNPIGPAWVQSMARDITALGSVSVLGIILCAVVGYMFLARKHASAWLMLAAVLGGTLLNSLLKYNFARPRPEFAAQTIKVMTASFPSGHAALSAITYLTLAALLTRTTPSRWLRIYFVAIGVLLTLFVGISRVYLGVHYPTDVLAGWCVGSAWALGCWAVMTRLQGKGRVEQPGKREIAGKRARRAS
jgi:undecaprenyl-diphosphatase